MAYEMNYSYDVQAAIIYTYSLYLAYDTQQWDSKLCHASATLYITYVQKHMYSILKGFVV